MGKEIQSAWRRIDTREAGDGKERCDRRGGGGSIRMCDGGNQRMYDRHGGGSIQGMRSKGEMRSARGESIRMGKSIATTIIIMLN